MTDLPPPKTDLRMYQEFTAHCKGFERSGSYVLRKAIDEYIAHGKRVNVQLERPLTQKIPTALIGTARKQAFQAHCAGLGISVSQGVREAVALYLHLDETEQEIEIIEKQ